MRIVQALAPALAMTGAFTASGCASDASVSPPASSSEVGSQVSQHCPPQGGYQIDVSGDIPCPDAYEIAGAYDLRGEKRQDIGAFTCFTGNADTLPMIFQCVSENGEFAVVEG